jgi:hypothetical protein
MAFHVTRTIEYEYDSAEEMVKDIACWTLRPSSSAWFRFNTKKRARSRIVNVAESKPVESPVAESAPSLAEAELALWLQKSDRHPGYVPVHKAMAVLRDMAGAAPSGLDPDCVCGHPESHHSNAPYIVNDATCCHLICDCQGFKPEPGPF